MASPEAEHLFNEFSRKTFEPSQEGIDNAVEMFSNITSSLVRKVTKINTPSVKNKNDLRKIGMIEIVIT